MHIAQCSVHTHSTFCDGKSTPEEMAAAAYAAGVKYYGFSGHSHTPIPHEAEIGIRDMAGYHAELVRLREKYAGRMEILFGIEQDSFADAPVPPWTDYWIGSVHNLFDPATGTYHGMDWSAEKLRRCAEEMFRGDMEAVVERYYDAVGTMAERKPDILGHIDLITKFSEQVRLFDPESARCRRAALEALHRADRDKTVLEINTGAISRGYRTTPYPALFLLKEWRAMGGRIVVTADTHHRDTILYRYDLAAELAEAAGYRGAVVLTREGWKEAALRPDEWA